VSDTEINLGGAGTNAAMLGTAYRAAEDTLLTALGTFATACGSSVPGLVGPATTLNTAITAFKAAAASYLSTVVKVQ
jgi:hypothetical protein